jgi:hypothetical protein
LQVTDDAALRSVSGLKPPSAASLPNVVFAVTAGFRFNFAFCCDGDCFVDYTIAPPRKELFRVAVAMD